MGDARQDRRIEQIRAAVDKPLDEDFIYPAYLFGYGVQDRALTCIDDSSSLDPDPQGHTVVVKEDGTLDLLWTQPSSAADEHYAAVFASEMASARFSLPAIRSWMYGEDERRTISLILHSPRVESRESRTGGSQ